MIAPWLAAAWAVAIAIGDVRSRRIANALLLAAAVPALLLLLLDGRGPLGAGPADSLLGAALCTVPWLPGWRLKMVGAGDVKYAACIGLLLGWLPGARAMVYAAVILGIMALAARLRAPGGPRLPMGVALSAGLLIELSGVAAAALRPL